MELTVKSGNESTKAEFMFFGYVTTDKDDHLCASFFIDEETFMTYGAGDSYDAADIVFCRMQDACGMSRETDLLGFEGDTVLYKDKKFDLKSGIFLGMQQYYDDEDGEYYAGDVCCSFRDIGVIFGILALYQQLFEEGTRDEWDIYKTVLRCALHTLPGNAEREYDLKPKEDKETPSDPPPEAVIIELFFTGAVLLTCSSKEEYASFVKWLGDYDFQFDESLNPEKWDSDAKYIYADNEDKTIKAFAQPSDDFDGIYPAKTFREMLDLVMP